MDYHAGNLEPAATIKVGKHLSACVICQNYSSELSHFEHLLQAETKPVIDNYLTKQVMEKVAHESAPAYQAHLRPVHKLATMAAIAVLVLIGILGGLELGDKITAGLTTGTAGHSEIISLVNEMELEPLERMLLNLNNPDQ